MKLRFVKETDIYERSTYFTEEERGGLWYYVSGSLELTEEKGKEKFEAIKARAHTTGAATHTYRETLEESES